MKTFRVTYVPHHREDKEWVDVQGKSSQEVVKNFKGGIVINVEEQ